MRLPPEVNALPPWMGGTVWVGTGVKIGVKIIRIGTYPYLPPHPKKIPTGMNADKRG